MTDPPPPQERALRPPAPAPKRRSSFTIILALIGCTLGAAVLLALPTGFIGPVIVFGGLFFFGIVGFHYVVWGRWIDRIIRDEQAEDGDSS